MSRVIEDLKKAQQETERKGPANMLQAIRTRFTSGRPRKVPVDMLGPMFAVMTANNERDRIRDFITEQGGDAGHFIVKVFVVTLAPTGRQRTWAIPEGIAGIVAQADEFKKIDGLVYAGMLVTVHDDKSSAVVRYVRPFIVSPEASESLAEAALKERFGKGGK
jgi:hypothetical protein